MRGLSNNRTASRVSGPTRAELPPSSVPMRVASGQGSDIGSAGSAAGGRVGVCGDLGGGLFAELDVPAEAGKVLVPGFGLELGGGAAVSGQVLERGVPQLVKRPALLMRVEGRGRLLEQVVGARVGVW